MQSLLTGYLHRESASRGHREGEFTGGRDRGYFMAVVAGGAAGIGTVAEHLHDGVGIRKTDFFHKQTVPQNAPDFSDTLLRGRDTFPDAELVRRDTVAFGKTIRRIHTADRFPDAEFLLSRLPRIQISARPGDARSRR